MNRLKRAVRFSGRWLISTSGVLSIAVMLPVATFLVTAWLYGWQLQAVLSGSMSPTYPVGSLLVIETTDASQVELGMPIVFEDPQVRGRLVTHRVVGVASAETLQFWTQGDANASRDPFPVPARLVHGRVMWQVSHLGTVVSALQGPWTSIALLVIPFGLLLAGEARTLIRRRREGASDES